VQLAPSLYLAQRSSRAHTYLLRQGYPVASGAVLLDIGLERGVLLRRPWALLHASLVAARSSPRGASLSPL
jgi:hypothetical protein